jgi:hypothetical protein
MKTSKEIQQFILNNHEVMSNVEMAQILDETVKRVGMNYATLSGRGLVPLKVIKNNVDVQINKLNKLTNKLTTKVETDFKNISGDEKDKARKLMVKTIKESERSPKPILTLPFEDCLIEQKLLSEVSKKFTFLGCERKSAVYNKMLMTIANNNLPINTYKGLIGDKIKEATTNQYSHLLLDYCGQLGTAHVDINHAISFDIVEVGGTIAITLNKRITPGTESIYELMEKLNPQTTTSEDTRTEHALRTFINRVGGFKYSIEDVLSYYDTSSMILMIVRRIA